MKEKKYFSLYKTMKEKILSVEYRAGEKLPSKRVIADKTGCSVVTVEAAYSLLADEGYIQPRERSGYYVCHVDAFQIMAKTEDTKLHYLEESVEMPEEGFAYSLWFKTVRKVMSEQREKLFAKAPNKGCSILRNAIADYLGRYRGMMAQPEQIIIGSGSEQLYETVVKILGREKVYGIEDPSYAQIEAVYRSEGATISKLKMGKDGIESADLEREDIDVLHVTPFGSYPTGVTATAMKRWEYLAWAKNGRYLVEDDFNSEFFMPGQPIETLYAMDQNERVVYINTFSKSLSSSMRMGYMILPNHLMEEYDKRLGHFSCSVPVLDQYVLAEFMSSGNFERHLNRMRRKMKK